MKLLKIRFDHLKMFEHGVFELDLYATDRVPSTDESAYWLDKSLYSNSILAFAGVNASGKTTALNLIDLACSILDGVPINTAGLPMHLPSLFDQATVFKCAFHHNRAIYVLESRIDANAAAQSYSQRELAFSFTQEALSVIPISSFKRAMLRDWSELKASAKLVAHRGDKEARWDTLLAEDMSITAAAVARVEGGGRPHVRTLWDSVSPRYVDADSALLSDILRVFDQRIERLEAADAGRVFSLCFKGQEPVLLSREGLDEVLSSGTQRGLSLVQQSLLALNCGGYLLVDELENHLNRQLVNVIVELFAAEATNPKGATIVFTTHYPQLLDAVHRKDNVYFLARGEADGVSPIKYSDRVDRIENKKSEVFASNFIRGTAPRYTDVNRLKAIVRGSVAHE